MNLVIYWSGIDIAFVEIERKKGTKIVYIKHHQNWSVDRGYIKNFFHHIPSIIKIYFQILFADDVKIFGTNAIRIFAPLILIKKNVKVVFNEVPRNKFPINVLDKLIMTNLKTYVSSESRRKYFLQTYKCDAGILENVPFLSYPEAGIMRSRSNNKAVYMGLLHKQRFPNSEQKSLIKWLDVNDYTLDVYGKKIGDFEFLSHDRVKFFESVPHKDVAGILAAYNIGIVCYFRENLNNELCAPLKIFDYISAGLKVLSVNKNVGMCELSEQYPALFNVLGDDLNLDNAQYLAQRTLYLDNAIGSNIDFAC